MNKLKEPLKQLDEFQVYIVLTVPFFIILDFLTNYKLQFGFINNVVSIWKNSGPQLLLVYVGWPVLFSYLIYKIKLDVKYIIGLVLILSPILEYFLSLTKKSLLDENFIIASVLIWIIYFTITFIPKILVEKIKK